jgi:hypothetical protein
MHLGFHHNQNTPIYNNEKKVQTIKIKKIDQEAKAKNKPTKLSKKGNHQNNIIKISSSNN